MYRWGEYKFIDNQKCLQQKVAYQLNKKLCLDSSAWLVLRFRALCEEGVYLVNEYNGWLVDASHSEQSTNHLLAFTDLDEDRKQPILLAIRHSRLNLATPAGLTHFEVKEDALILKNVDLLWDATHLPAEKTNNGFQIIFALPKLFV